jgi:virginiamycin B lyase
MLMNILTSFLRISKQIKLEGYLPPVFALIHKKYWHSETIGAIAVALLIFIITISTIFWPYLSTARSKFGDTAMPVPRILAEEIPQSRQRVQTKKPKRIMTQYSPWGVAIDQRSGFLWVAEPGCEMAPICPSSRQTNGMLGKFSLADGSLIAEIPMPQGYSNPLFTAVGSDGRIWFTQPNTDAIGILDPKTSLLNQYTVSVNKFSQVKVRKGSAPYDLVFDKNGNLWFTEFSGDAIGFINTKTLEYVENVIPTYNSEAYDITIDPRGNIWFVESAESINKIGTFTPTASGKVTITEYPLLEGRPHALAADKNGTIWYTLGFSGRIGSLHPSTGKQTVQQVTNCSVGGCTFLAGITTDRLGNIWFTDALAQRVGFYTPSTSKVRFVTLSDPNAHPQDGIVIDHYGTVWFTERYRRTLVMAPDGNIPQ